MMISLVFTEVGLEEGVEGWDLLRSDRVVWVLAWEGGLEEDSRLHGESLQVWVLELPS